MSGSSNQVFSVEEMDRTSENSGGSVNKDDSATIKEWKKINILSEEFTARISTPGLHMLSDGDVGAMRKVFWLLLFIGATGFTFWNASREIIRYNLHDTETSITVVQQRESVFPAVTICPRPSVDHTSSRFSFFPYKITFNGVDLPENQTRLVSTVHGMCLQVNGQGEIIAKDYGTYSNLRFESEYIDFKPFHTGYTAFQIYVQPHKKPPSSYIVSEHAIPLNSNASEDTEIRIQKIQWTHENPELGNCVEKAGNYANYSKNECIMDCLSSFIMITHECVVTGLTETENGTMPHCGLLYAYLHDKHIFENILHGYLRDSKCKETCPQECDTLTYSLSKYTTKHLYEEALTFVMIYFETLDYQHIVTREAYDGWLLLCNVGGALGLLLGATLLTVVDIVDYCIITILSKINAKAKLK